MSDQAQATSTARGRAIDRPRSVLMVVAFVLGVIVGRAIAYQVSRGGFDGGIGAGLWLYGTILLVLVALALTAIAARIGRRPVGQALRPVVLGACVLGAGAIVGNVSAAFTGGTYRDPLVLSADGTITLQLDGLDAYRPAVGGIASCSTLPDSAAVGQVSGEGFGTLGERHLRGTLSFPFGTEVDARADLWIDGADLPDGAAQPTWSGPIAPGSRQGEDVFGIATFDALALAHDPKLPAYVDDFPETLAGRFEWSCGVFDTP